MGDDLPESTAVLAELYGAMQTFRALGFPSDNLFVAFGVIASVGPFVGRKCVSVQLMWKDKVFRYTIAPVADDKKFAAEWMDFATAANAKPDDVAYRAIREHSECSRNKTELIAKLKGAGFSLPIEN